MSAPLSTPAENKSQCYYLHRSRDSVSPVCGIFLSICYLACYGCRGAGQGKEPKLQWLISNRLRHASDQGTKLAVEHFTRFEQTPPQRTSFDNICQNILTVLKKEFFLLTSLPPSKNSCWLNLAKTVSVSVHCRGAGGQMLQLF